MNNENENLLQSPRGQQQKEKNNLGKKILIGLFLVTAILMAATALITSAVAIIRSDAAINLSNYMPVKYTTYERIGNTECPKTSGTSLIYSGITISYSYNSTQNAPTSYSGFRCMPRDKEYINYYTDKHEYDKEEVNSGNVTGYITFTDSKYHDALCAVCMVEGRGTIMVMPGTDKCLDSWTTEYNGYLMTGYTCVDIEMEEDGENPDRTANLRHEVISSEVNKNYQDNNVLSCAVCSK